jgi:hypothetical protein
VTVPENAYGVGGKTCVIENKWLRSILIAVAVAARTYLKSNVVISPPSIFVYKKKEGKRGGGDSMRGKSMCLFCQETFFQW